MAFEFNQMVSGAGPALQHAGEGGQQQVVDLRAVGGRAILEQARGGRGIQMGCDAAAVAQAQRSVGIDHRQRAVDIGALALPEGGFLLPGRALCVRLQAQGPVLHRQGTRWQRAGLAGSRLGIGTLEVFKQDAPGHTVNGQVVDHQQQALLAVDHPLHCAQQRALGQVEAALSTVAQALPAVALAWLEQPAHVVVGHVRGKVCLPLVLHLAEAQAQGIVGGQQCSECLAHMGRGQRLVGLEHHRLVPALRLRYGLGEELLLHRQ
ncbi:hypothetical protein D3C79_666100 [compost metagenome]